MTDAEELVRVVVKHVQLVTGSSGINPISQHVDTVLNTPNNQEADTQSLLIVTGTKISTLVPNVADFTQVRDQLVASLDGDAVVTKPRGSGKTSFSGAQIDTNTTIGELTNHLLI